jgi:hypothetical protein
MADRPGQTLIGDRNYFGKDFEQNLVESCVRWPPTITDP